MKSSKNIVKARIDVSGNVIVGDNNTVINLNVAIRYNALLAELTELNQLIEKTYERIAQPATDVDQKEGFERELKQLSGKRDERYEELKNLAREVLELEKEFIYISATSTVLEHNRKHHQVDKLTRDKALLDVSRMNKKLNEVVEKEEIEKQLQSQSRESRERLASEYLILARLTAIDFSLINRFEKSKEYFEQSLRAEKNVENLFAYASFLHKHNQFNEVQPLYEKVLEIWRHLAESNPQTYLPEVALTLDKLGVLQRIKYEFDKAEQAFQEALDIRRSLTASNPNGYYLPALAETLNNLGNLYTDVRKFEKAKQAYYAALEIRRALIEPASASYNDYLLDLAITLNDLGVLQRSAKEFDESEKTLQESLEIRKNLSIHSSQYLPVLANSLNNVGLLNKVKQKFEQAEQNFMAALDIVGDYAKQNPQIYLPFVADILNNLGDLRRLNKEFDRAEKSYLEALKIRRTLSKDNPRVYLLTVAGTALSISILYSQYLFVKESALTYAEEALEASQPFVEFSSMAKQIRKEAIKVVRKLGLDSNVVRQRKSGNIRTIRIFLASSSELQSDRMQFEVFINRKNKQSIKKGVFLHSVTKEELFDVVSQSQLQDEYNKIIQECELCVMMFFTKIDQINIEEFEAANTCYEKSSKPSIYLYFREGNINTGSIDLKDLVTLLSFKDRVNQLGYIHNSYGSLEEALIKFNTQLDKLI